MSLFFWFVFLLFVGYNVSVLMQEVTHARRRQLSRKTCEAFRRARL